MRIDHNRRYLAAPHDLDGIPRPLHFIDDAAQLLASLAERDLFDSLHWCNLIHCTFGVHNPAIRLPGNPGTRRRSALLALGAEVSEGRGSRVRVHLNGVRAVFHRPHPRKEVGRGALRAVQRFLKEAGIESEE